MNDSQYPEIPEDIARYAKEHGITFDLWSPVVHKMLRLRMLKRWKKTEKTENNWRHWQG